MRYLLDTNVCIAAMRNQAQVIARLTALVPSDCGISTISSYEILTGVAKCSIPAVEQKKFETLLGMVEEIPFDAIAAQAAGQLRADLEARGLTIGPYDLLIAGQALSQNLILVTNNTSEFRRVPGLSLEDWQSNVPTTGSP
jgi:tRNA(fMet)-specific endonuclease VapC